MNSNKTEGVEQAAKEMWSIGWDAAITLANNIAVDISDEYNNDDHIEQADAASKVAKRIRQHYGDRSYFPEEFPPSPPPGVEQRAKEYADRIVPNANPNDAPYCTTGERWDEIYAAYIAGSESQGQQAVEHIESLIDRYKSEQLPNRDVPFHEEAEINAGFKHFLIWLKETPRF